jgi:3-hydroxyacyl-[acyl-carrier-protein] dehydratase
MLSNLSVKNFKPDKMAELPWHTLLGFNLNKNGITGQFDIPANSLWFEGHFPGEPVLPGVSMLCMIQDLIRKAKPDINITGLRRIRFRQLVHANELLNVKIAWEEGVSKTASFDITSNGNLISSGFIETDGPVETLKS